MKASLAIPLVLLLLLVPAGRGRVAAQSPMDLTGSWTLNRASSQFPEEFGFGADTFANPAGAQGGTSGGRGGRRGGGGGGGASRPLEGLRGPLILETQEDVSRRRFLTDEVRLPPERLTIVVTPASVTITPEPGAPRTVQPGRRDESVTIGPISATTNATWAGDQLTIGYSAEAGRVVRYTYSVNRSPRQLIVDVEFAGRGGGDQVRRIYDPAPPGPPAGSQSKSTSEPPASAAAAPLPRLVLPPGALLPGARPPGGAPPAAAIDQRPDAPLKGLARLGLVVEGIEAEATKCGLKAGALEAAVSKRLTDSGFRVTRDGDDDTYLYVNINAVTASAGLCVTRYDVTLYSHTAAPLVHTSVPVELQVELLHKGGLAGGPPAQNGDTVTTNVLEYVDQFATRIKSANK